MGSGRKRVLTTHSFFPTPHSLLPTPLLQSAILDRGLFLLKQTARLESGGRINRCTAFFDVANDALLVDNESGARTEALGFVENAIVLNDLALLEVAEKWEAQPLGFCGEFLRPMVERGHAVHADAENLCFRVGEFGDISLIRLHLLRSAPGEGQHVE